MRSYIGIMTAALLAIRDFIVWHSCLLCRDMIVKMPTLLLRVRSFFYTVNFLCDTFVGHILLCVKFVNSFFRSHAKHSHWLLADGCGTQTHHHCHAHQVHRGRKGESFFCLPCVSVVLPFHIVFFTFLSLSLSLFPAQVWTILAR